MAIEIQAIRYRLLLRTKVEIYPHILYHPFEGTYDICCGLYARQTGQVVEDPRI